MLTLTFHNFHRRIGRGIDVSNVVRRVGGSWRYNMLVLRNVLYELICELQCLLLSVVVRLWEVLVGTRNEVDGLFYLLLHLYRAGNLGVLSVGPFVRITLVPQTLFDIRLQVLYFKNFDLWAFVEV